MAGFLDKLSDVINNTADEITDKAKEISEVSSLNSQIRNQEKTIERCYNEIGKLYYEAHKDDTSDAFLEQIERITKAKQEVERFGGRVMIDQIKPMFEQSPEMSEVLQEVVDTRLKMLICGGGS